MATEHDTARRVDEGLEQLLAVEARLEAELRAAEAAATALIEAAKAEAKALSSADDPTLAEELAREEREAVAAHEHVLEAVAADRDAQRAKLAKVSDVVLEQLARRVVSRVFEVEEPRRPA